MNAEAKLKERWYKARTTGAIFRVDGIISSRDYDKLVKSTRYKLRSEYGCLNAKGHLKEFNCCFKDNMRLIL